MKAEIYNIVSIAASIAYFIPILLLAIKKMWKQTPLLLFSCYWLLTGIINIMDRVPGIPRETLQMVTLVYNMFDIPIILFILGIATQYSFIKTITKFAAPGLLAMQLLFFIVQGWQYEAAKYTLAIGLLIVLFVVLAEIAQYMMKLEHSASENAMIYIYIALLFAYGTFIVIYIFDYVIKVAGTDIDNFLIYYISSLIAIIIASFAYMKHKERKYI
ncbi:MAG: hypothetical protein K2P88_10650 [Chitinophagaceae bacterium]|uniref:hypothetical protein n=1 Tax=unclassified Paraflavitalea TaxID=2798305 RepID=UPI003D342883|nr:hypothetical protein [Chitinophagaceae bacterium]